ncbi:MAG TPA: heavy metal transporter, partial [Firmicutes bacterium]|nr:heavy metal transporter [Bacillota bacterium]
MEYTTINPHNENGDWKPKPASHWKKGIQIFSVILVILGIYYGFKVGLHRDGMQFFQDILMIKYLPRLGNDSGLGLLFLLGILTSFHCLAMCGAIVISQMNESENTIEGSRALVWFYPSLFYNAGRVISYTLVGAIIGGLGQAISFIGIWKGLVPFIGGLWMIVMGMNLLGIFPLLR